MRSHRVPLLWFCFLLVTVTAYSQPTPTPTQPLHPEYNWIFNPDTRHYYTQIESMGWVQSELRAVQLGGHLVTINDQAENDWIAAHFYTGWIGLVDKSMIGEWVWVSGQSSIYRNWGDNPILSTEAPYALFQGSVWYMEDIHHHWSGIVELEQDSLPTPTPTSTPTRNESEHIITTVAGNGSVGFSGDSQAATKATLDLPNGLDIDSRGAIYVADYNNQRIRKIDASGIISTVAGNGDKGFTRDGVPATEASLNVPYDVALDSNGNLYIADKDNHRIRKVGTDGTIQTVAGNGNPGVPINGAKAIDISLDFPGGIAVDRQDNLYIACQGSHTIHKVDRQGIITTIAGTAYEIGFEGENQPAVQSKLNIPSGLVVDDWGNLYFADFGNERVRKIDPMGVITTFAGTGARGYNGDNIPAVNANLFTPMDVEVDKEGNLFIADDQNHRIRKVDTQGIITTVAGVGYNFYGGDGGDALDAAFSFPTSLALDDLGNLYISDRYNARIRKVTKLGVMGPFPTPTPSVTPTPTPRNWLAFSGDTLQENRLNADPPSGYNPGKVTFTTVPAGSLTDGKGMEIRLAPGQGMLVVSQQSMTVPALARITGAFKASNQNISLALVALNSPIDGQLAYTNLTAEEVPVNDYRQYNLFYDPPSDNVQLAVQAVNSNLSALSTTVWVDNLKIEESGAASDGAPLALEVDGSFDRGIDTLLANINEMDGAVTPFFESLSDIALRLTVDPSTLAANIGTRLLVEENQYPLRLLGQINVIREPSTFDGLLAFVMTNGYQNIGLFRFAGDIPSTQDPKQERLIMGGDFTVNNPNIPIYIVIQNAGPNVDSSVVVDDLAVVKK